MDAINLDPNRLKALAHPLRLRLLTHLRDHGPATATELARSWGDITSGTTSYHLRQLAKYGFVTETVDQPKGRDRRWQAAHSATRLNTADLLPNPETGTAMQALLHETLALHFEWLGAWLDAADREDPEWVQAAALTDRLFQLRPTQLKELVAELNGTLDRYETVEANDDTQTVTVCLYAFRRVDVAAKPGTASPQHN